MSREQYMKHKPDCSYWKDNICTCQPARWLCNAVGQVERDLKRAAVVGQGSEGAGLREALEQCIPLLLRWTQTALEDNLPQIRATIKMAQDELDAARASAEQPSEGARQCTMCKGTGIMPSHIDIEKYVDNAAAPQQSPPEAAFAPVSEQKGKP